MRITRSRLIAATMVTSAAAVLLPAATAVAYISPPLVLLAEAQSPATLVARGAAVDVPVEYSCTADSMFISVQVTERVGRGIASGFGSTTVPCNSATHRTLVQVPATSGVRAFRAGTASTRTYVSGCYTRNNRWACGDDLVMRTIRIAR